MERDQPGAVLAGTSAAVLVLRPDGTVSGVNPAAAALLGAPAGALAGADAADLLALPREVADLRQALRRVARTGVPAVHETRLERAGTVRSLVWALSRVDGAHPAVTLVGIDISSTRTQLDDLQQRAGTDELTGLANRTRLVARMQELAGTGASVAFCDLNGFKAVNDLHGHAAGDRVLVEVARRFLLAVRGEDLVARLGGDEFVVVAPADPLSDPEGLRRRLVRAVQQPMLLGAGLVVLVGVSVGMARLDAGREPSAVLQQADRDMYAAKPSRTSASAVVVPQP